MLWYKFIHLKKKHELLQLILQMRFVEIFIRQPIDRFSGDKGMLDLLFRDLCFSRKAVDGRPFFHRSSTAHGKIFPQLYYRLDHATIVHVHRQPWFGDLDARAIRLRNIFFFPRYSNLSDSKNSVEIYIYIYIEYVFFFFFLFFFLLEDYPGLIICFSQIDCLF